jgi:putative FmdB family regulatory protein
MRYAFKCKVCEKGFEIVASTGCLPSEITCPDCRSNQVKRLWFPIPAIYKSNGFTKQSKEKSE